MYTCSSIEVIITKLNMEIEEFNKTKTTIDNLDLEFCKASNYDLFSLPLNKIYNMNPTDLKLKRIEFNKITLRTSNCLKQLGIEFLDQLLITDMNYLLSIKNFGIGSLIDITRYLTLVCEKEFERKHKLLLAELMLTICNYSAEDYDKTLLANLNAEDQIYLEEYLEAFHILGNKITKGILLQESSIVNTTVMLIEFINQEKTLILNRKRISYLSKKIPINRLNKNIKPYLNAYKNVYGEFTELNQFTNDFGYTFIDLVKFYTEKYGNSNNEILKFITWYEFDINEEIEYIDDLLFKDNRNKLVMKMRAEGKTLNEIGEMFTLTRERIRQIEHSIERKFIKFETRNRLIAKISAELNNGNIATTVDVKNVSKNQVWFVYLIKKCYLNSNYNIDLELFIINGSYEIMKLRDIVLMLPEVIDTCQMEHLFNSISEINEAPSDIIEYIVKNKYKASKDIFYKPGLKSHEIIEYTIKKYFSNGIYIYKNEDINRLKKLIYRLFPTEKVTASRRGLATQIAKSCILCDKGKYKMRTDEYISEILKSKIFYFINNTEEQSCLTNTVFEVFKEDLLGEGITNTYYLHGMLKEIFRDDFVFRRDYIIKKNCNDICGKVKNSNIIYSKIVDYIQRSEYPVSKREIMNELPGITESMFNQVICMPEIINYFGKYLHCSKLRIRDETKRLLYNEVKNFVYDGKTYNVSLMFEQINRVYTSVLPSIGVFNEYSFFSVLEYLFEHEFKFDRPYIADSKSDIIKPYEYIKNYIGNKSEVKVDCLVDIAKTLGLKIYSKLDFINSFNYEYLLVNKYTLANIEHIGLSALVYNKIEDQLSSCVVGTIRIGDLLARLSLPTIKVDWDEWLIYSAVNKWSNRFEVATSTRTYINAVPLLSIKGKMNESEFMNCSYKKIEDYKFEMDDMICENIVQNDMVMI